MICSRCDFVAAVWSVCTVGFACSLSTGVAARIFGLLLLLLFVVEEVVLLLKLLLLLLQLFFEYAVIDDAFVLSREGSKRHEGQGYCTICYCYYNRWGETLANVLNADAVAVAGGCCCCC